VNILLGTDILIDVALDRTPHSNAAGELLYILETQPGRAFIAWHTASNFYYLVAPARGRVHTRDFLLELTRFVGVAPATARALRYAAQLSLGDFEDALQVAAAHTCGAEVIATRNVRDYTRSPIRAAKPQAVLNELGSL
jgi:predicted nucleic acid-binding protein